MQPKAYCNLDFQKPIKRWDEAIPLGNGESGCLIWGESTELRFSLDRGDIWDVTPCGDVKKDYFTYDYLVKLAKEKKEKEIREKFDSVYKHPLPTKLPAGKLLFDFGESENITSSLDLETAEAKIQIQKENTSIVINSFLHGTKKVGFVKINLPLSEFSVTLKNPEYSIRTETEYTKDIVVNCLNGGGLGILYYPEPLVGVEDHKRWFVQQITDTFSYGIFVRIREVSNETEIVYSIATSNDGENWAENADKLIGEMVEDGYDSGIVSHKRWWEAFWNKSEISIPDKLFERNWYMSNYLLASCSRKGGYPMSLQGVWTADDGQLPPWKGDYHHDLNTQMSYYHYLKANHMDEGASFIEYLWKMRPEAGDFAKSFYNGKGICLPSVMAINGTALGGWPMYALAPTNQIWLCQAFERHYRFTGDEEFLKEKVYVYLSETAEFILDILEEKEDGKLYLPVSSSPEIHDDNIDAWVTENSNYDLSLIRYLFIQLKSMAGVLMNGEAVMWDKVIEQLSPLAIDEDQVLMISPNERLKESHRHHAHLMAIHPLRLLNKEDDHEVIDASVADLEILGSGYWVGFSFTWMAELYAIQRNGNGAAMQLRLFWENICSPNGFHLNGDYKKAGISWFHYRPFTLEANMCAADALQEMLLQTENGIIDVFPAIPNQWKEQGISFKHLRAEKGVLVSARMENSKVVSLILEPENTCIVKVREIPGEESPYKEMELKAGERYCLV